jgi:hypothetical protein
MSGQLSGQLGEVEMVIQIKRAKTGEVEEHRLIGKVFNEEKEQDDGTDTQHSSSGRGD